MPISDRRTGYADFGWANGWCETPAEIVRCRDLGHRPSDTDVGPPYRGIEHVIVCDVCRIVYRVDSSD
jgi:hypothetical protein